MDRVRGRGGGGGVGRGSGAAVAVGKVGGGGGGAARVPSAGHGLRRGKKGQLLGNRGSGKNGAYVSEVVLSSSDGGEVVEGTQALKFNFHVHRRRALIPRSCAGAGQKQAGGGVEPLREKREERSGVGKQRAS